MTGRQTKTFPSDTCLHAL